jgi:putative ABC transport system ATP-binding protein
LKNARLLSVEPQAADPAAATRPILVRVAGVIYGYGEASARRTVLENVRLNLVGGEFVCLTGPSGAGKTTLLTLIGALRTLQAGSVEVFGQQLAGLGANQQREIRRRIGFIFQEHNLFDALTPFQTLWLTMQLQARPPDRSEAWRRARELLAEMGMEDYLEALPRTMSTGQKQRIAIARALINEPALILADEPTASLDHDGQEKVIDLLRRRLAQTGAAALVVTHDPRIFDRADRVVRLVDGCVDAV